MKYIKLTMINEDIRNCPSIPLKQGFSFRYWQEGDERIWAEIETEAGEFEHTEAALARFTSEFTGFEHQLKSRCVILQTTDNRPVGTAMGWYNNDFRDGNYGRLHWVGIIPPFQGQNLARPLVTKAMNLMNPHHTKAYLTTQTTSYKAIKIYLDYGFHPLIQTEDCLEGWKIVSQVLGQDILKNGGVSW